MMKKLKPLRRLNGEDGLSLVEMIVAIGVLGILAVSAYPLMLHSIQAVSLNNITTSATVTTQALIEQIRVAPSCGSVNALAGTTSNYKDARGMDYKVVMSLPAPCVDARAVVINFTATRTSDARVLLKQKAQIFIPPLTGDFNLTG